MCVSIHPLFKPRIELVAALHTIHAAHIALCTGLHVTPAIPDIPGIQHIHQNSSLAVEQSIFHSIDYKSRAQLSGKRVMVLGTGETGMDLAYEAAKAGAKEVVLCSRSGYVSVFHLRTRLVLRVLDKGYL